MPDRKGNLLTNEELQTISLPDLPGFCVPKFGGRFCEFWAWSNFKLYGRTRPKSVSRMWCVILVSIQRSHLNDLNSFRRSCLHAKGYTSSLTMPTRNQHRRTTSARVQCLHGLMQTSLGCFRANRKISSSWHPGLLRTVSRLPCCSAVRTLKNEDECHWC